MEPISTIDALFGGEGEMRARCRALDWSTTPLGEPEHWAPALRTIVRTILASPFPINLWCGPELALIYNDAYRHVLGAKHPHALGRPGTEVWSEIWDEIEPLFERIRAGGPPAFAEDAPFVVERAGLPLSDGAFPHEPNAWFTFSLSPVRDEDGALVAFLNVVSETTPRILAERATEAARASAQQAEARLREVFAHAPAFLAVLRGPQHVFEYVNTAYYQLVGHRELLGRPLFEALPEVRGQGFEVLLDTVLQTGEPFIGREIAVMITPEPGGTPVQRFVDLVYYPIREADGTCSGVVAHGSDVTDHVLSRAEALRARAEAEQANLAKSQFLANMSHEIRTPINAVMGYTDLLDAGIAGSLTERQQEFVDRIQMSSRHLLGLVDDVLDLAKVEAGEMMVSLQETGIEEILRGAVEMVEPQAVARGLTLRRTTACSDAAALCDPGRVRQIVLNLLSNAVKFTEPGGTIDVRCSVRGVADPHAALPDTGPWILIEVEDTGAGIPDNHIGRIFDPFVQIDTGHTRRVSGTGLGLTISRRFARLMGGDVTVRSSVGRGSCFSVWLAPTTQDVVLPASTAWERIAAWPQNPQEVPGLGALGQILLAAAERVEEELLRRLRADPHIRSAQALDRPRLADHTAGVIAVMARSLTALDEGLAGGALIEDGTELQRLMAASHGRQRRRLGWGRPELQREYQILHDLLDSFLRREGPQHTTAEINLALGAVHRLIDQMEGAALAAFDERD